MLNGRWELREGREACDEFREDPREDFFEEEAREEPREEPREECCEEDREMTELEKLDWRQLPEFLPSSVVLLLFLGVGLRDGCCGSPALRSVE